MGHRRSFQYFVFLPKPQDDPNVRCRELGDNAGDFVPPRHDSVVGGARCRQAQNASGEANRTGGSESPGVRIGGESDPEFGPDRGSPLRLVVPSGDILVALGIALSVAAIHGGIFTPVSGV